MVDISFKLDPEILIGKDTINRAGSLCSPLGSRILIVTEQVLYENKGIQRLVGILEDSGLEAIIFDEIPAQATADVAESVADLARGARVSSIIGFGGLKTQTIARIAAIVSKSDLSIFDLLDGKNPTPNYIPYIAIPTTGRDPFMFSDFFVTVDHRDRLVKQVKSPKGLYAVAIIDGALSESLPGKFSSTTAFDGFCVSVEAYCSNKAGFFSDALLEQAISLYGQMINNYTESHNFDLVGSAVNAGFLMSLGSSVSSPGIGTALAYAINGRFPVAKSWCSTVLLPYIMEKLIAARPEKMAKVAALMGEAVEGVSVANAAALAVETIRRRMGTLQVPARLKEFDLSLDRLIPVAEAARNLEFVTQSPWTVTTEEAFDILKQAF
ncbi:iron-containing alcohol dehydrogenase [Breznakiellaceae bacterium SP9]